MVVVVYSWSGENTPIVFQIPIYLVYTGKSQIPFNFTKYVYNFLLRSITKFNYYYFFNSLIKEWAKGDIIMIILVWDFYAVHLMAFPTQCASSFSKKNVLICMQKNNRRPFGYFLMKTKVICRLVSANY